MSEPEFFSNDPYFQSLAFKQKALKWAGEFPYSCYLDGNGYAQYPNGPFPNMLAVGHTFLPDLDTNAWNALKNRDLGSWFFGFLSYDVKNIQFPELMKDYPGLGFPMASFFKAEILLQWEGSAFRILGGDEALVDTIEQCQPAIFSPLKMETFTTFWDKETYLKKVAKVQDGIRDGWVYEVNLCRHFECSPAVDGLLAFSGLQDLSPMPFAGWYRFPGFSIACASPERYLKKKGTQLISQPIKGTAPRGQSAYEDAENRDQLRHSEKEQAENLMIVDLVRNDLCRVSQIGSTQVSELFGIYSFPRVHQMISTVVSEIREGLDGIDALASAFPMGSMTGAPKLEVMQWINKLEQYQRGPFSGALGYFEPGGNYDFNVLIRSVFTNELQNKSGFSVGSAITIDSEAEAEWLECNLKAAAILGLLGNTKE